MPIFSLNILLLILIAVLFIFINNTTAIFCTSDAECDLKKKCLDGLCIPYCKFKLLNI